VRGQLRRVRARSLKRNHAIWTAPSVHTRCRWSRHLGPGALRPVPLPTTVHLSQLQSSENALVCHLDWASRPIWAHKAGCYYILVSGELNVDT
jgi:hypothetical protein